MRTIPDMAASDRGGVEGVATLLRRWQAERDADDFTALVQMLRAPLERLAARALRRDGIRDPAARDDVVSLTIEQLFRLGAGGSRPPPAFDHARVDSATTVDAGWAYVRCVARSRARDVSRAVRRRERLAAAYAAIRAATSHTVLDEALADASDGERLHAAIATLDGRSRELVSLLLDGKSQAVIAHVLGVCEGTVSRMRVRVIARLRAALAPKKTKKAGGGGGRPSRRPRCGGRG